MSEFRIDKLISANGQSGVELPKGVVGVLTASSGFSGNITGNVTGNVNAGVVTATSSIVVGNSFINATSIGIGTTTTAGRNAGVGTATGTLIYNTCILYTSCQSFEPAPKFLSSVI